MDKPKRKYVLSEEVAYGYEKKTVIRGSQKLICSPNEAINLLFDLNKDPNETNPICDDGLIEELKRYLPATSVTGKEQTISNDMKQRLKELGYF